MPDGNDGVLTLSDRLAHAMANMPASGISRAQLAARCSITRARLSQLLLGDGALKAVTAIALSRELGVRIEWLVLGEGAMRSSEAEVSRAAASGRARLVEARSTLANSLQAIDRLLETDHAG